jgi:translation initiation factor 2 beta subunit (eIF-2beta)/eIF-5
MISKQINIGGNSHDLNYRYKRDIIDVIWENVKGIQTRLRNLDTIAKQLGIDPRLLTTYLQKKIGACVSGNVIKGKVEVELIEKYFEQFITKNVLCPKCRLPEWSGQECRACGHSIESFSSKGKLEEIVDNKTVSVSDTKISKIMHFMYDQLEDPNITPEQLLWVDKALEKCWRLPEHCDHDGIIIEINKKFKKLGIPEYIEKLNF